MATASRSSKKTSKSGKDPRGVEQRRGRHILMRNEQEVDDLIKRIRAGEKFIVLCRKYSLDVVTKRVGGDLGWVRKGQVWPGITGPLFRINEIGGVIKSRTSYGWHVLQFTEQKFSGPKPKRERATSKPKSKTTSRPRYVPRTGSRSLTL